MLIQSGPRKYGWMKNPNCRQGEKEKIIAGKTAPRRGSDIIYKNDSIIDHKRYSTWKINAY